MKSGVWKRALLVALAFVFLAASGGADARAASPRDAALATLRAGKLGLFIHYGPSTLLDAPSTSAWMNGIWQPTYPAFVTENFHPRKAAVAKWVALAKQIGASYLVFTVKHHDGYRLWKSDVPSDAAAGATNWGVDSSHDLLAALAQACRKAHLQLYVYFSVIDWYSHAYRVADAPTHLASDEQQLNEILSRYGPFAGVWLDGTWQRPTGFFDLDALIATIHAQQPAALIGVNRQPPGAGEDFSIFESGIPGPSPGIPQQSTFPLGDQWFYSTHDRPKTQASVAALIRRAKVAGVSMLLDVPPRADGTFSPAYLRAVSGLRP